MVHPKGKMSQQKVARCVTSNPNRKSAHSDGAIWHATLTGRLEGGKNYVTCGVDTPPLLFMNAAGNFILSFCFFSLHRCQYRVHATPIIAALNFSRALKNFSSLADFRKSCVANSTADSCCIHVHCKASRAVHRRSGSTCKRLDISSLAAGLTLCQYSSGNEYLPSIMA